MYDPTFQKNKISVVTMSPSKNSHEPICQDVTSNIATSESHNQDTTVSHDLYTLEHDMGVKFSTNKKIYFIIVKINNYFKIYEYPSISQIKKLHDLIYSGSQFEVEYSNVQPVEYNILNENILNEYNFIKREFTDETVDDVAKNIKKLSESMAFFRDDGCESNSKCNTKQYNIEEDISESFRLGTNTRLSYETALTGDANVSVNENENNKECKDNKTTSIRGIDNEITKLCAYSTDNGIQYNQDVTIHENLNWDWELTASHKVLYNRYFYNAVLVDKFKYDLLLHNDIMKSLISEFEVISELYLKDEAEINEFSKLIMCEIFYSADDLRKIVNFFHSKNNIECPSISAIRKYIHSNFALDTDIANRIQFKVLFEDICTGMNINPKYYEAIKRSLPLLLTELGLNKKRYSEGIFWYGLKKVSGLVGPVDLNKNLDMLTSEIIKLREAQDTENNKVLNYILDSKIPTPKSNHCDTYPIDLEKRPHKPKRNINYQLRSEHPNPKTWVSPYE